MKSVILSALLIMASTSQAMIVHVTETSAPIFAGLNLIGSSRNLSTVNSRLSLISSGEVTFNDKTLTLVLVKRMPPCPEGKMCIEMMPAPVKVKLPVVRVVANQCAIMYVAKMPSNAQSGLTEEVVVMDYTFSKCAQTMDKPYTAGKVTYKVTGVSSLTKAVETGTAEFNVNESGFLRAQN